MSTIPAPQEAPNRRNRTLLGGWKVLVWALLLGLVFTAAAASAATFTVAAPAPMIFTQTKVVELDITNPEQGGIECNIDRIEFTPPTGWTLKTTGNNAGNWATAFVPSTADPQTVRFTAPNVASAIAEQETKKFKINVTARSHTAASNEAWSILGHYVNDGGADSLCFGSPVPTDAEGTVTRNQRTLTLGVASVTIIPSGASDLSVTTNQTLNVTANFINTRSTAETLNLNMNETATPARDQSINAAFTAAAGATTQVQFDFKVSSSVAARNWVLKLNGTEHEHVHFNLTGGSASLEPLVDVSKVAISTNDPTVLSPVAGASVKKTNFTITLHNRAPGTGARASAVDVQVELRFFHDAATGLEDHSHLFANRTNTTATLKSGDKLDMIIRNVEPLPCVASSTVTCTITHSRDYNVTAVVTFLDENKKHDASTTKDTRRFPFSTRVLTVDDRAPEIGRVSDTLRSQATFARDGSMKMDVEVSITEARLDTTKVFLSIRQGGTKFTPAAMTKVGDNWKITKDFADFNSLGSFEVFVEATDTVGNKAERSIQPVNIVDDSQPQILTLTKSPDNTETLLPNAFTLRTEIKDNFRVRDVYARAVHQSTGEDVFRNTTYYSKATSLGLPMACGTTCPEGNGTYELTVEGLPLSGTYQVFVYVRDAATPSLNERTSLLDNRFIMITATSALKLVFDEVSGQQFGKNLTADLIPASQAREANFTRLKITNTGGGNDTFNFDCRVLPALSNVTGGDGAKCIVITSLDQLVGAPDNTFRVSIFNTTGTGRPFVNNDTGFRLANTASVNLEANVTTIANAKPGEQVRIELIGKPVFATKGQGVVLGWEVAKGWDMNLTLAEPGLTDPFRADPVNNTLFETRRDIKPTRIDNVRFQVRNTGNVDTWFNLSHAPLVATGANAAAGAWGVAFVDPSGRLQTNNSILLRAAGAPAGADRATITAQVTAPAGLTEVAANPIDAKLTITASNATDRARGGFDFSEVVNVTYKVLDPSVGIVSFGNANITMAIADAPAGTCTNTASTNTCAFNATNATEVTIKVHATSTLNRAGDPGFLRVHALVATPCDASCPGPSVTGAVQQVGQFNLTMNATGGVIQGQNGTYSTTLTLLGEVGLYKVRIWVSDFRDQLLSSNTTFTLQEPTLPPAAIPGTCCFEVREGTTVLGRDAQGRVQANLGSIVAVRAAVTDEGGVGRAELRIEKRDEATGSSIVCEVVPMVRQSASQLTNGTRATNATFEGISSPRGRCGDAPGAFVFRVNAFDAVNNTAAFSAQNPFFVDFLDRRGPSITAELLAAGLNGTDISAEPTVPVNLTATIRDNGDPLELPGGNVQRDSPNHPTAEIRKAGTVVQRLDLVAVPETLDQWHLVLPASAIADPATYTILLKATDKQGNPGDTVNLTLTVAPNLAPTITVASPAEERQGKRMLGASSALVFTVNDRNIVVTDPDAIVVETRRGNASFGRAPAGDVNITSTPTISVRVSLTGEGAHSVRITATDSFGESNTTTVEAVVDLTAPANVQVQLADVTTDSTLGKAFRASLQDPFTVAPDARFFVTASDTGSGVSRVSATAQPQGGTARTTNLSSPDARFTLEDALGSAPAEGRFTLSATARDLVGNSASSDTVTVILDDTPPDVGTVVPANPLRVQASDAGAGVRSVTVTWSDDSGGSGSFVLSDQGGGAWSASWPGEVSGDVTFTVRATDQVGNQADGTCAGGTCGFTFGDDRAPTVDDLQVATEEGPVSEGDVVRGSLRITWAAVDPEGKAVRLTLTARGPSGVVSIADKVTSKQLTWDTTRVKDGSYTLSAVATDGTQDSTPREFQVRVRNLAVSTPEPTPGQVGEGQSVLLAFEVAHPSKGVNRVVAVVTAGGQQQSVPLRDDGTLGDRVAGDGVFSSTFTPRLKGAHAVDLDVEFDDGDTTTLSNVANFQAQGALQAISMVLVGSAMVLALAVVALGAFGFWRWR